MSKAYKKSQEYNSKAFVAQVAAATATREDPIFAAPCAARVTGIRVTPQTATTGNTTNTKNLNLINKGAAGAGATEVGNLDLPTGINLVAFDETNIPFNATFLVPGVVLAEGDVLTLQVELVGTGVIVGPFDVTIDWHPLT